VGIQLLQSLLRNLVIFVARGGLSIIHVNLVPIEYSFKQVNIVYDAPAVDDHQEVVHEDREGELDVLLLKDQLLGELRAHGLDVTDVDALDLPPQVSDLYLICEVLLVFVFLLFLV
jgi:hypothetical protein